jgi:hypothetical protein
MTNASPKNVAQTNLQLYAQLRESGFDTASLNQVHAAYSFAAKQCATLFRGSGKPFSCHLVGVASLCAVEGATIKTIVAALLHAIYQPRVGFAESVEFQAQRHAIAQQFGSDSELLTFACFIASYDATAHGGKPAPKHHDLSLEQSRSVKMILLADSLEDALDCGVSLHGKAIDDASVRGGARWRLQRMQAERTDFLAAASTHGFQYFVQLFDQLLSVNESRLSQSAAKSEQVGPFTHQYSSFRIE